jgi:hypothetical protein
VDVDGSSKRDQCPLLLCELGKPFGKTVADLTRHSFTNDAGSCASEPCTTGSYNKPVRDPVGKTLADFCCKPPP